MKRLSCLSLLVAAIVLTACSSPVADDQRLVVYSGRSESLVGPLIAEFTELTGIAVDVRYGSTPEIAATLLEEGENSPADLFYAQDPGGLGAVADAGLLAPLPAETLGRVPVAFTGAGGDWVGVSGRARVLVYNTDALTPEMLPADLWALTDPVWRGRVGWAPTNGSFQAMITGMRSLWGEEQTRQWLMAMQANDPVAFEGNTPIVAAVGSGEIEIGLVNHYYVFRFIAEEGEAYPARNHFLDGGGPGALIMVSGAGVLKTAAHPDNARRFIDFLLSTTGQQYFAGQTYEYPLIDSVSPALLLPPLQSLMATAPDVAVTDLTDLAGTAALLSDVGILP